MEFQEEYCRSQTTNSNPPDPDFGGRGVPPTPPPSFFTKGGYPPPPSGPNRFPLIKNDDPATSGFSVGVSSEIPDLILERMCSFHRFGGEGVPPTPPPSFFPKGGHPPPHVPGPVGVPSPSMAIIPKLRCDELNS